jgi:hypothetical protein
MDANEHCRQVGAIVTNLQALELHLRYFLLKAHGQPVAFPKVGEQQVSHNYLTNRMPLKDLVVEYKGLASGGEQLFAVDFIVVTVRDAIAHGRLVTQEEAFPGRLWKFHKPKGGQVQVEFSELLTREWLVATSNNVDNEREKVLKCFKSRGYVGLS